MLLKAADDKTRRLALLQDLQKSDRLDYRQKRWLRDELSRTKLGIQGESESAHYLDNYFKDGQNHVVLHDLRFEFEGEVAQIDHLVINRLWGMYLIETKNYAAHLTINERGEYSVDYDGDCFGVPSPLEQSKRHERVLRRLLQRLEIGHRTGAELEMHHVVMFSPKVIIKRPPVDVLDTSNIIKADQFPTWHEKYVARNVGVAEVLKGLANVRSTDTIRDWGEKLMRQHRPENPLRLPDFMQPKPANAAPAQPPRSAAAAAIEVRPSQPATAKAEPGPVPQKRLICLTCGDKISFAEGKFCWNNEARFKGGQYCRTHQGQF